MEKLLKIPGTQWKSITKQQMTSAIPIGILMALLTKEVFFVIMLIAGLILTYTGIKYKFFENLEIDNFIARIGISIIGILIGNVGTKTILLLLQ
ncbi:hypothetical protein ACFL2R_03470 [Patescibacteria group bacterium]